MRSDDRYRTKPDCGTRSGYDYHTRQARELPCLACRRANADHWREQRQIRKQEINLLRRRWQKLFPKKRNFSRDLVLATYGSNCHICGNAINFDAPSQVGAKGWELGYHSDHVVPLSRGGADDLSNIRPAHAYCNLRKWATIEKESQ